MIQASEGKRQTLHRFTYEVSKKKLIPVVRGRPRHPFKGKLS